jgi:hypothetical protein
VVAADAVEVDVDPVGRRLSQQLGERPAPVVERRVEPELVEQVRDLLVRPRAADDAVAADLRELRDEAPDRAGRRRDPDDVAVAQACHVEEPGVRRQPVASEHAEVGLRRRGVDVEPAQRSDSAELRLPRRDHGVVAPARGVPHGVAGLEACGTRVHHVADRHDPVHRLAQRERGEVAGRALRSQPQAQARVDRRPRVPDQHLTRPGLAHRRLDDAEVALAHLAARIADELHLTTGSRHDAN